MFYLPNLYAITIQKVLVINGKVISNHDLTHIKKLYKTLQDLHLPVVDALKPERYFYRKIFFEYIGKFDASRVPKITEEDVKGYLGFQLMQLNISEDQLKSLLEQHGVSFKSFQEYLVETLKWYRYVAMNYHGLIKPSDKAVEDFMKQINKQMQEGPSTFINGHIVQIKKTQESFVDEMNINAMTKANTKEEFLTIAKNYTVENLSHVPLEAVNQPVIKAALQESHQKRKPVICSAFDDVTLVIYVSDAQKVNNTITKKQATEMLSNKMITGIYGESCSAQISRKLKVIY